MDLHAPFLAEICEHPDDDAPRLIYADWLEEQGDSRAAGIRLQVEAAKLPGWSPRRIELELHARLAGIPECEMPQLHLVGWGEAERGFLREVRVLDWGEFESAADQIFRRAPIATLGLWSARPLLQGALDSPWLRRISELHIEARPTWSMTAGEPPGHPNPGQQQVGEPLTTLLASPMLARLKRLTMRSLHESPRDAISRVAARLEQLALTDILLVFPADVEELCAAIEPAALKSLTLSENRLGDGVVQLARESLQGLHTLSIQWNALSRLGAQALVNSTRLEELRTLELDGNRIAVPGLAALSDGLSQIEYLSLAQNLLGRHAIQELALAHGLTSLRGLNLAQNNLGIDAFRPLRTSQALPQLVHLNVARNGLDAEGLASLLATPLVEQLESLDLSGNPLGPDAAELLAASPALTRLQWLNLAETLVDDGASALARPQALPSLRYVDLRDADLCDETRRALAERFPCSHQQEFAVEYAPAG